MPGRRPDGLLLGIAGPECRHRDCDQHRERLSAGGCHKSLRASFHAKQNPSSKQARPLLVFSRGEFAGIPRGGLLNSGAFSSGERWPTRLSVYRYGSCETVSLASPANSAPTPTGERVHMYRTSTRGGEESLVRFKAAPVTLEGNLSVPEGANGVVLFAPGSGAGRPSPPARHA